MIRKVTKSDYETIARLLIKAFKNPPWNEEWDYHRALQRVEQLDDDWTIVTIEDVMFI